MKEIRGNLWDYYGKRYYVCIPTNGFVKKDGSAVMGRGVAQQARDRFPKLAHKLGESISLGGNKVHYLGDGLFSFPTKHNWWDREADLKLIEKSAIELRKLIKSMNINVVVIPRPGCGNGNLSWEVVEEVLKPIFNDDRFLIIQYEEEETYSKSWLKKVFKRGEKIENGRE